MGGGHYFSSVRDRSAHESLKSHMLKESKDSSNTEVNSAWSENLEGVFRIDAENLQ